MLLSTIMTIVSDTTELTLPKTSSEQISSGWLLVPLSEIFTVVIVLLPGVDFDEAMMPLSDTVPVVVARLVLTLPSAQAADEVPTIVLRDGKTAVMHWNSL